MKKTVLIVSGASFGLVCELAERLRAFRENGSPAMIILGVWDIHALSEVPDVREILCDVPNIKMLPVREFRKKMKATNEKNWSGSSFRARSGGTALARRQIAMRRYGRKR
jgi:hypothetical protein